MLRIFQILILLTLIFIFLQDCILLIGTQQLLIAPFFIVTVLLVLFFVKPKYFLIKLLDIYKYTPFKYLVFFILFMFFTSVVLFNIGVTTMIISRIILIYGLTVIPAILFAIYIFPKYFSYKKLLHFFIYAYQLIIYYGILDFLCRILFRTKAPLYSIICSRNYYSHVLGYSVNLSSELLERASSIFFEPSFFATFIFLFIPFCYVLYRSNLKILNDLTVDKFFKIYLIVISWIALFLTKSPIYIILSFVYIPIFFYKNVIKFLKKYVFILILLFFLLPIGFLSINPESSISNNPVIVRVEHTIRSFGDLESLVVVEPSLATRIISTVNTFQAVKKHPLVGVGYGNTKETMYKQYSNTNTPLTYEILRSMWTGMCFASPNIFWSYLLQTGFIGTFLLYLYFIKSLITANKIKFYFIKQERVLLETAILIAINYIIISFYWSIDIYPMMWFIFGILNSFIFLYKNQVKKYKMEKKYVENDIT